MLLAIIMCPSWVIFFSKENEIPDKLQPVKSIAFYARSERPFSYVFPLLWRTVIRVAEICLQLMHSFLQFWYGQQSYALLGKQQVHFFYACFTRFLLPCIRKYNLSGNTADTWRWMKLGSHYNIFKDRITILTLTFHDTVCSCVLHANKTALEYVWSQPTLLLHT